MKESLIKLLKVKSIWSIGALAVFIYLTVTGGISGEVAMATVSAIVTYYFCKQEKTSVQD